MPGLPVSEVGVGTATTSGAVTVATSSTALLANNPDRVGGRLQNDHATQVVYIQLATASTQPQSGVTQPVPTAPTAVANKGFRLLPVGANSFDLAGYTGPVAAISVGGSSEVLVTEW